MALTFQNAGLANTTVASATQAVASISANVGEYLIVVVAADNSGTAGLQSITSVTDSVGNTYDEEILVNRDPGNANEGVTLAVYVSKIANNIVSGTVTANFSPNTPAKSVMIKRVIPDAGKLMSVISVGAGVSGSATTGTTPAVSVTSGDTIFGAVAVEQATLGTADSDTTNGSWSAAFNGIASTGTNTTSITGSSQQKTVTATGNQTYNLNFGGTARDYALNYMILREIDNRPRRIIMIQ
jgi:hypothetical protein